MYEPVGCKACRQIGYTGRIGIFELMVTSEKIRQLAHERTSSWNIKQAALAEGMRTLRQDGWLKVFNGRSTVDEIVRATKGEKFTR
jgi:general secretion pathway protein E/type IV pilus assembly protein PilB